MDLIGLGAALGAFFDDGAGPSHDRLDTAFLRAGLAAGDPAPGGQTPTRQPLGKTKRVRQVLVYATDSDGAAGVRLSQHIVSLLRAAGAFSSTGEAYAGDNKVARLRDAFLPVGFTLDESGGLRPTVIENLVGTKLTDALQAYVQRVNLNPDDAPLQIGSGKELDEATARHVIQERTASYTAGGHAGKLPSDPGTSIHAARLCGAAKGPA